MAEVRYVGFSETVQVTKDTIVEVSDRYFITEDRYFDKRDRVANLVLSFKSEGVAQRRKNLIQDLRSKERHKVLYAKELFGEAYAIADQIIALLEKK